MDCREYIEKYGETSIIEVRFGKLDLNYLTNTIMYLTIKIPVDKKLIWQIGISKDVMERMVENYLKRYVFWKIFVKEVENFKKQHPELLMDEEEILETIKQMRNED